MADKQLVKRQVPEQRELEKKQAELAALEGRLAERELEFVTLQNELRSFEGRYLRIVGRLHAELDDLEAQLADAHARRNPENSDLHRQASDARARAAASAEATGAAIATEGLDEFTPRDNLKKLYRDLAKRVHPDLSINDAEHGRRTRTMAEANRAYAAGDEATLRALLDDWVSSPEAVQGEGVAAELVRTIRKIHQVERRLTQITSEMDELTRSERHRLKQRVDGAHAQGRDLLREMAAQVQDAIERTKSRIQSETAAT